MFVQKWYSYLKNSARCTRLNIANRNLSMMGFGDLLDQVQADPRAFRISSHLVAGTVKPVKNVCKILFFNSRTIILYFKKTSLWSL